MQPDRPKRRTLFTTRTFVIVFAIVEAVMLGWFIASDVRARSARRAAAAAASSPATRSAQP